MELNIRPSAIKGGIAAAVITLAGLAAYVKTSPEDSKEQATQSIDEKSAAEKAEAELQLRRLKEIEMIGQNKINEFAFHKIGESRDPIVTINTESLSGRIAKDVVAVMLGVDGLIPKTLTIDPKSNLQRAWNRKIKYSGISEAAAAKLPLLISAFEKTTRHPMTLKHFEANIDLTLSKFKKDYDFEGYGTSVGLDKAKIEKLKHFGNLIDASYLLPYLMTEMLPGKLIRTNGEVSSRNIRMLDFILSALGPEYIDMIPAQGDEYLSLGGYQFTSLSIRDDESGQGPITKASKFYKKQDKQLPGSVYLLRGGDHHVAAYLLALHHFAQTLKNVDSKKLENVDKFLKKYVQVVGYLGACHNQSLSAKDFAKYINDGLGDTIEFKRKSNKLRTRIIEHYNKSVENAAAYKIHGPIRFGAPDTKRNVKDLR